jgi:acetyl esterase/lipase
MHHKRIVSVLIVFVLAGAASVQASELYTQHKNIVYGEIHGVGLVMDIFVPTGDKNGHGIVDVASGAWFSSRSKIQDHKRARAFDAMCGKGFTVFAIRSGSISRFSVPEMIKNLNTGIRWVKDHAADYEINPQELGMMGASAGGHLASLAAVTANDATRTKAVGVFFPPTDFLDYGGQDFSVSTDGDIGKLTRRLAFPPDAGNDQTPEELAQGLTKISPARLVTAAAPPFLLIHGDADEKVPLQQSESLLASLKTKGVSAELIVKPGGGHPWFTIHEEMIVLTDWFVKQLIHQEAEVGGD